MQFRLRHVICMFTLLGATLALAVSLWRAAVPFAGKEFDSRVWRDAADSLDQNNPRAAMVADIRRRLEPGMSKGDVKELLGIPEMERPSCFLYILGAWSGFRVDYDALEIEFDERSGLVKTTVIQL